MANHKKKQNNKNRNDDSSNPQEEKGITGTVIEALPNTMFKVLLDEDGSEELCFLAGKMRMYRIRVMVGDKVVFEKDPYGGKGRIFKRL